MTNSNSRMVDALDNVVKALTASLEALKREVSDDRLDMRSVQTQLQTLEKSVEKLVRVVLEGNGSDPLRGQVAQLQRELVELRKDQEEFEARLAAQATEDKKNARSRNTAILAAVVAVGGEVARWIFSAKL